MNKTVCAIIISCQHWKKSNL